MDALRHVVEQIGDAALRIGDGDDAQCPRPAGTTMLARLDRLIGGEDPGLPTAVIGLLGQAALGAQLSRISPSVGVFSRKASSSGHMSR